MKKIVIAALAVLAATGTGIADPLPSWNPGGAKARIIAFVDGVTDPGSSNYVDPAARVAVFDNDGTLWSEQPLYFQFLFAMDRLAALAEDDPSILTSDALRAAARGDIASALSGGKEALMEIVTVSHSGLSTEDFQEEVRAWFASARHPKTGRAYSDMTYQPMLELLYYLRDKDFTTYIVSGGGVHFMRAFAERAYGIPPEQVIGSTGTTRYVVIDGIPTLMKDHGIAFIDDKEGKPVAIDGKIGKRPIFAAGNSDGDFAMIEWVTAGEGPRLGMIVHHTDAAREYAYDRDSRIGRLARGLDEGPGRGWVLIDMARDWAQIWP